MPVRVWQERIRRVQRIDRDQPPCPCHPQPRPLRQGSAKRRMCSNGASVSRSGLERSTANGNRLTPLRRKIEDLAAWQWTPRWARRAASSSRASNATDRLSRSTVRLPIGPVKSTHRPSFLGPSAWSYPLYETGQDEPSHLFPLDSSIPLSTNCRSAPRLAAPMSCPRHWRCHGALSAITLAAV
jgi:hypothetical protein